VTRPGGSFAVLLGTIVGVTAALARRGDDQPTPPPEPQPPQASAEREPPATAPARAPASPANETKPAALDAAAGGSPPSTAVVAPLVSAQASASHLPPPAPVASLAELKASEIKCYEQDPVACRRASDAYAAGTIVQRDNARAENYRKVEITQLVRLCEKSDARACLGLADLHAAGDGVAQDARRAQQLAEHARLICRRKPSAECQKLGLSE
jgi:TPR repeat protein